MKKKMHAKRTKMVITSARPLEILFHNMPYDSNHNIMCAIKNIGTKRTHM
jgi:hypothetical protein